MPKLGRPRVHDDIPGPLASQLFGRLAEGMTLTAASHSLGLSPGHVRAVEKRDEAFAASLAEAMKIQTEAMEARLAFITEEFSNLQMASVVAENIKFQLGAKYAHRRVTPRALKSIINKAKHKSDYEARVAKHPDKCRPIRLLRD